MKYYLELSYKVIVTLTCFLLLSTSINANDLKSVETPSVESKKEVDVLVAVRGFVVDDFGEPMPGVEVSAVGSEKKTVTNTEGKYKLWTTESAIIEFAQIGVVSKKEKITSSHILNVTLSVE